VLRAACSVRDRQSLAVKRYSRERGMDSNLGAPARYLRHDEIVLTHRPTYSETYARVDVDTNAADASTRRSWNTSSKCRRRLTTWG
jgi:hypothetical protein